MKTLIFDSIKSLKMVETDIPQPKSHEILIKIDACAICTWEQRVYLGIKKVSFPFVGGHEISGTIIKLGDGVNQNVWNIGDRVVYGTNLACGDCYQCKVGNEQNCEHFNHSKQIPGTNFIGMGGFSEYLLVEPRRLFKVSPNLNAEVACLSEPLSCCIHSINTANIELADKVLIVGCGIMGLFHLQLALKRGAYVVCCDLDQTRLDTAISLGAHATIDSSIEDLNAATNHLTNNHGYDVIFNTIPFAPMIKNLDPLLAINGRHVLYSSYYPDGDLDISADHLHKNASKIMGTANSNSKDFIQAIGLLENNIVDARPFVSKVINFDDYNEAFEAALLKENYRVVLKF